MTNKKTVVIGASTKPERYSNKAIRLLRRYGHPVEAIGLRHGEVGDVSIKTGFPELGEVHTFTIYMQPQRQKPFYEYIIRLKPTRVIFNPGTENDELINLLESNGIEVTENCTLVMLNTGLF